jgi:hypothetical protein
MKFINTIDIHLKSPDISTDEYIKAMKIKLGEQIKSRKKIYLDTNYWVGLRDVILGRQKNAFFVELLKLLQQGVKNGKLLCPISDITFYEISKQSDFLTCETSVNLIDELSDGVILLPTIERSMLEIMYFLRSYLNNTEDLYTPAILAWSKVGYILGITYPTSTAFSPEDELVIQKYFFDQMWSISLSYMFKEIGMESILNIPKFRDITEELNEGKIRYASECKSFKQLFSSEIAGAMEVLEPNFEKALIYMFEKEMGYKPSEEEIEKSDQGKLFTNIIYNLFKKNKLGHHLPSVVIGAGLHASVRNDIQRKYKANDLMDYRHAQAALPYFDYFFTERNLKDLILRKNIGFHKKYDCQVLSEPKEAVESVLKIL